MWPAPAICPRFLLGSGPFHGIVAILSAAEGFCMIRFLTWLRSILLSVVSGLAKTVVLAVLAVIVLVVISLARGDGLPGNMVLTLDLREPIADSAASPGSFLTPRRVTVMDVVLGLDAAARDGRVK